MKILIIQDQLRIGGTERQSLFLAKELQNRGHDTVLLRFRPGGHLSKQSECREIQIRTLQSYDTGISLWAPNLVQAVREADPEVILCMGRTANCYAGYLQRKFPGTPVVGSIRTGKSLFPLHRWSLNRVHSIIVNSNWWKRRLREQGLPEDKINVIHNGLLLNHTDSEYEEARSVCREKEGIGEETCLLLNVATFRPGKRHRDLLKAARLLKQEHPKLSWQLWLVGDGKAEAACRKWTQLNGLDSEVRFFGYQEDPFRFYAASDLAVSLSREDSLPNFLIEAQAAGLPVIAASYGGIEETFVDTRTGILVEAGDQKAFVARVVEFITEKDKRKQFGHDAKAFSRTRFSTSAQLDKVETLFHELTRPSD